MPTGRVDVSIVLLNWNSLAVTAAALTSIQQHTQGVRYEVIVVDNGSSLDASTIELPRRFPWIRLIANRENRGFSVANNQGIAVSRGRYVLVLNNDTVQTHNAVGECVRYMDSHPDVGVLGILHHNDDPARTVQPSFFPYPKPWRDVWQLMDVRRRRDTQGAVLAPSAEQDVDWLCGSFLFVRRECLDAVGPLDERFFIYDEDIDWCLRARRAGWRVTFWPGASMIHVGSAARPFMRDKTFIHFRSHLSYIRKNHSALEAAAYYAAMGVRLTLSSAWQTLQYALGRTSVDEMWTRYRRQTEFLLLRPGRRGAVIPREAADAGPPR